MATNTGSGDGNGPSTEGPREGMAPQGQMPPWAGKVGLIVVRLIAIGFGVAWLGGLTTFCAFLGPHLYRDVRVVLAYRPAEANVTKYTPPASTKDDFGETQPADGRIEYEYVVAGTAHSGKWTQPRDPAADNKYERALAGPAGARRGRPPAPRSWVPWVAALLAATTHRQ